MSKKKLIVLLSVLVAIIAGSVAGALLMLHQPAPKVTDMTNKNQVADKEPEEGKETYAAISSNVNVLTVEESKNISTKIKDMEVTNFGLFVRTEPGTALEKFGMGDIFCIQGDETSPFGGPYFGKVSSVSLRDDAVEYILETPMVDEVFDELKINFTQDLMKSEIAFIELVSGASVVLADGTVLGADTDATSDKWMTKYGSYNTKNDGFTFVKRVTIPTVDGVNPLDDLVFHFETDLAEDFNKLFKPNKSKETKKEKYDVTEGSRVKVYITDTGKKYHKSDCCFLYNSKNEITLTDAVKKYTPCSICNPPIFDDDDGIFNDEASLTLSGDIGFEALDFYIDYDWDILNRGGLETLSIGANGTFVSNFNLELSYEISLGGRTTKVTIPTDNVKMEGLDEKLIPLAFVGFNGVSVSPLMGNKEIEAFTGVSPLTIGVMIYVDINGNIKVGASAHFDYKSNFEGRVDLVKNGKLVAESDFKNKEEENKWGFGAEAKADVDTHLGASALLYVFNMNVVDVAVVKIGVEGEGYSKVQYSSETDKVGEPASADYYLRAYLKLLDINIKLKTTFKVWEFIDISKDVSKHWTYMDKTLKVWGVKNPVKFNSNTMSYTSITASDGTAKYYKDTEGNLVKEVNGTAKILSDEPFFVIAGIDDSFIYVLESAELRTYNLYRINKKDGTKKQIAERIVEYFLFDENDIYYTLTFDDSVVVKLNRETLVEESFASIGRTVTVFLKQEENFYVVAQKNVWFMNTIYTYLVNSNGDIIAEYGSDPEVEKIYSMRIEDSYYAAIQYTSTGYLRGGAAKVYWMSLDRGSYLVSEGISGWSFQIPGIFVTRENDISEDYPYKICYYRASDGQLIDVTEVSSRVAFFTMCQNMSDDWFFFDQSGDELILYKMDSQFRNKQEIKRFNKSEWKCDIENCGVILMDSCIYFYEIIDDRESRVIYRYDLY